MDISRPSGSHRSAALLRIGDVIAGKYEVESIVGEGGMGVVVAARHKQLGELVAIKVLHPGSSLEGEAVARLIREAQATISIKSEHVVQVRDVGTLESGSPYILMELLQGSDLSQVVHAHGQLPVSDAVDYVLQACEAIAEAHARGIVHRDLKPSNLFLTQRSDGSPLVKVLDFGISKALVSEELTTGSGPQVSLTATRAVFGSPLYMSPEQVRSAKRVDARTDIWALGIILHELLTGSHPFSGETMPGVLAAIAADPPELVRVRRPDAPEGLERAICRCLVKDVALRFQTVAELALALAPHAPAASDVSVQRVLRLASNAVSHPILPRTSHSAPPNPVSSPTAMGSTVKATTTTHIDLAPRKRGIGVVVAGGVGLVLATMGVMYVAMKAPTVAPLVRAPPAIAQASGGVVANVAVPSSSAPPSAPPQGPNVVPAATSTVPLSTTAPDAAAPLLAAIGHPSPVRPVAPKRPVSSPPTPTAGSAPAATATETPLDGR